MRCGKPEHQLGQKCPAKNAKCKDCHKIGHFHKVCQSRKRTKRANLVQTPSQDDDDTHINKIGVRQPNPPRVNPAHVHQETSCKSPLAHCAHVHKSTIQVCKPGELLALRKVKHPHNGRTSVNRLPLMKQDIL